MDNKVCSDKILSLLKKDTNSSKNIKLIDHASMIKEYMEKICSQEMIDILKSRSN